MASIFTYDPDVPRVSSPWLTPTDSPKPSTPLSTNRPRVRGASSELLSDYGITRLDAEPQEGPTEYKLHLLLSPKRPNNTSTTSSLRQKRLEQLTTQLLWRLQQSSSYHASSINDLVLPKLPDTEKGLEMPLRPNKLLPGLEESRGALYEIGVLDDGTLVGLTMDDMDESLKNLRVMAASLGCNVDIVRMVDIGDCVGHESLESRHQAPLWVAEALVTPDLGLRRTVSSHDLDVGKRDEALPRSEACKSTRQHQTTEQLRITLTGPTTSGKSSLLGTLSTATLDNGRGKSRLSLLKHRHELVSGVTSSVAQELLGYSASEVINFASRNVTSWTDIHTSAEHGRLVFVSDSAGHPRYRRTIVRGLVGWAPHWTVLCIAGDDGENAPTSAGGTSSAQEVLGTAGAGIDLAKAHLELCLKLDMPLAIVITKLDLASKSSLRQILSKVLTAIKATGRIPSIIQPDQTKTILESDLATIPEIDENKIRNLVDSMNHCKDFKVIVPIIMTSAANGTGINLVHALLKALPIPAAPTAQDFVGLALNPEQPACLFHIEDVFGVPASYEPLTSTKAKETDTGSVVAGHLRFGSLTVGDTVVVGPFPADPDESGSPSNQSDARSSPASFGASLSHPSTAALARIVSRNPDSASVTKGEWYNARIVSIRNLRLPVHKLEAGQVGTIGIVFDLPEEELSNGPFERPPRTVPRIRKGMVVAVPNQGMILTGHALQAASGFSATFEDGDINSVTPGTLVVVYISSIRASARVLCSRPHVSNRSPVAPEVEDVDDIFRLKDTLGNEEQEAEQPIWSSEGVKEVTFELMTHREWIELGSEVLVMPGGGPGLYYGSERGEKGVAGLEGFVGKVVEVVD